MGLNSLITNPFGASRVQFIQQNNTVITFDASLKETHSRSSPATEFPIETGENISDHIILKPQTLELNGIITDTPLNSVLSALKEVTTTLTSALLPPVGVVGAATGVAVVSAINSKNNSDAGVKNSPSVQAYVQLLRLQENGQPFDVLTSLYRYTSMWITDLSVPRDVQTGKALIFTVKLQKLIIVQPQSVTVAIFANPNVSANQANLGNKNPELPNGFEAGQKTFHNLAGG